MVPDPQDTIVALSTAAGPGCRAIVRLSGQQALTVAMKVFCTDKGSPLTPGPSAGSKEGRDHIVHQGELRLPGMTSGLPGELYVWTAPRSFTGQDVVEMHTISSPPLVELVVTECLQAGARAAEAGEFTMRAFLAGKLDLTRAEAIVGIIEAGSRDELKQALAQLAGGMTRPLHQLREDLLNLLADVEAGLDFVDEDIRFIEHESLLQRVTNGLAQVTLLHRQLDKRS